MPVTDSGAAQMVSVPHAMKVRMPYLSDDDLRQVKRRLCSFAIFRLLIIVSLPSLSRRDCLWRVLGVYFVLLAVQCLYGILKSRFLRPSLVTSGDAVAASLRVLFVLSATASGASWCGCWIGGRSGAFGIPGAELGLLGFETLVLSLQLWSLLAITGALFGRLNSEHSVGCGLSQPSGEKYSLVYAAVHGLRYGAAIAFLLYVWWLKWTSISVLDAFMVLKMRSSCMKMFRTVSQYIHRARLARLLAEFLVPVAAHVTVPVPVPALTDASAADSGLSASRGTCPICRDEFTPGKPGFRLPQCSHVYHTVCLLEWLQEKSSCPICRSTVRFAEPRLLKEKLRTRD